jgi:hypothetical protein
MADEERSHGPEEESGGPEELSQDPFVERLRPDPSQPPQPARVLEGLLGDSDREGYKRLYFNRELDHYAEFRVDDVVYREPIPPDRSPFVGLDATRVGVRRDATIEFTRARTPRVLDEFDLDVRLAAPGPWEGRLPLLWTQRPACPVDCTLFFTGCPPRGCTDPVTGCPPPIDTDTCATWCAQPTCPTSPQHTCETCQTCDTRCRQPTCPTSPQHTCQTCRTCGGQETCPNTRCECETRNPHVFTCGDQRTCFC